MGETYAKWEDAPKAEHRIEVELRDGYPRMKAVCLGGPGAQCRLCCDSSCEEYPCREQNLDGEWVDLDHTYSDAGHPEGECNVTLYLNEGDIEECYADTDRMVAMFPITLEWTSDGYYQWSVKPGSPAGWLHSDVEAPELPSP